MATVDVSSEIRARMVFCVLDVRSPSSRPGDYRSYGHRKGSVDDAQSCYHPNAVSAMSFIEFVRTFNEDIS